MELRNYRLDHDIYIAYIQAKTFPQGIEEAHQALHALVNHKNDRKFFGVSRPENQGAIVYKAGVEEHVSGEFKALGLPSFVIATGNYYCIELRDYAKDLQKIGEAFDTLLSQANIDPQGYCVEMYEGKDVKCIVRKSTS